MRLLVVGAGSTGGYFGGRLAQAGRDVTFLVRPGRAGALRRDGLRIRSRFHGDATLHPLLLATGEPAAGAFDAVLLAVKAYSLPAALDDMAPHVGPGTVVLPVLNGMRHMDALAARFGAGRVAGCACKVATTVAEDGAIEQIAPFQELDYGELDRARSARMEALDGFMQGAGFTAVLSPDIVRDMWDKWTTLAAIGALCCLLRGNVGVIEAVPGGPETARGIVDEVVAAVTAEGHEPRPAFVDNLRSSMTLKGSAFASSMFRDMQRGAPAEGDQSVGDLVGRARRHGLAVPLLTAAWAALGVYGAGRPA